jgi:hypothetical protein
MLSSPGDTGEAAILTYGDEVTVVKTFDSGNIESALRTIRPDGKAARMIDAGMRAAGLLAKRPAMRSRVLLFIGQPIDSGSESKLVSLEEAAERENVTILVLLWIRRVVGGGGLKQSFRTQRQLEDAMAASGLTRA